MHQNLHRSNLINSKTKNLLTIFRGKTLKSQKVLWWQKPIIQNAFYTDLTTGAWHATFYTLVSIPILQQGLGCYILYFGKNTDITTGAWHATLYTLLSIPILQQGLACYILYFGKNTDITTGSDMLTFYNLVCILILQQGPPCYILYFGKHTDNTTGSGMLHSILW